MCLSLIQENVGLYSSYFIKGEKEDTELDIIIPRKRIPNYFEKLEALNTVSDQDMSSEGGNDLEHEITNEIRTTVPGTVQDEFDLMSNNSDGEDHSRNESTYSNNKDDSSDEDETDTSDSSSDSETDDNDDGDDSEEEEDSRKDNEVV